jgi:hypothetical protein
MYELCFTPQGAQRRRLHMNTCPQISKSVLAIPQELAESRRRELREGEFEIEEHEMHEIKHESNGRRTWRGMEVVTVRQATKKGVVTASFNSETGVRWGCIPAVLFNAETCVGWIVCMYGVYCSMLRHSQLGSYICM